IISTFNRPDMLKKAVKSIYDQNYSKSNLEICIVDNNPPQNLPTIKKLISKYPQIKITSLEETKQGISFATNAALKKCRYDKVILLDDDELADQNFCRSYDSLWQKYRTHKVGVIGGQIVALISSDDVQKKFDWMMKSFESLNWIFGVISFGNREKILRYPGSLFSGNMSFDRKTILGLGGFDEKLGAKRNNTYYYGHDIELCWRLQRKGLEVIYSPLPIVSNAITEDRFEFIHICKRMFLSAEEIAYIKQKLFKEVSIG